MKTRSIQLLNNPEKNKRNSKFQITQDLLRDFLLSLDPEEFTLFHLTTTYLPFQNITYSPKVINQFFINFYLKNLLPDLFRTRTWTKKIKMLQPIALTFLDEHQIDPIPVSIDASGKPVYASPVRLHHHSIVASRTATKDHFLAMVGDNTMLRYSGKLMTSNLKQCDADRIYYASKMLWKYPDEYLTFGFR
jgi:hypothetical protein